MRKLAIAMALASTALATPAVARDNSFYAGIEGGVMLAEDTHMDYDDGVLDIEGAVVIDHKFGWDVDLIAGYDFGMFRVEGELGYKRASLGDIAIDTRITGLADPGPYDVDG